MDREVAQRFADTKEFVAPVPTSGFQAAQEAQMRVLYEAALNAAVAQHPYGAQGQPTIPIYVGPRGIGPPDPGPALQPVRPDACPYCTAHPGLLPPSEQERYAPFVSCPDCNGFGYTPGSKSHASTVASLLAQ